MEWILCLRKDSWEIIAASREKNLKNDKKWTLEVFIQTYFTPTPTADRWNGLFTLERIVFSSPNNHSRPSWMSSKSDSASFNLSSIWGCEITLVALVSFTDSFVISLLVGEIEYSECNNHTSHNRLSLSLLNWKSPYYKTRGVLFLLPLSRTATFIAFYKNAAAF